MYEYHTPKTLWNAFNSQTASLAHASGRMGLNELNLSTIATILIQNVGRFAESYASDFLINWDIVEDFMKPRPILQEEDCIFPFGIRRLGVDHTTFLMSRLKESRHGGVFVNTDGNYRKVLALRVCITSAKDHNGYPEINCWLKDITDTLIKIDPEDEKEA